MAFVFRSNTTPFKSIITPGPGQYQPASAIKQSPLATAPFNQTSARKIWKENSLPGPGAYELVELKSNERAVIKNCGNTYAIIQTPIESSIFKSQSKRFQNNEETLPGPGQYSIELEKTVKQRTTSQSNSLHKYLQKSRDQNCNAMEVGLLAIGEEGDNKPQPSPAKKNEKKHIPFHSREERCKPVRPQTSLGPGSYEVNIAKQQKQCLNRKKVTHSIIKLRKNPPEEYLHQLEINKQRSEQVNNGSKFTKISYNSKKDDFFGSSVSRFATGLPKEYTPGPGEYEFDSVKSTSNLHHPCRKPAFGRSSQDSQMREIFISPFQVKVAHASKPHKPSKKKSVEGCFVFKEARFKQIKTNDTIDSNTMPVSELFLGKEGKQNKAKHYEVRKPQQKHSSKLLIKREITKKPNSDDRPLSYASEAFTISAKNKEKCQINAPFLSYVTRFNDNTNSPGSDLENLYCQSAAMTEYKEKEGCGNGSRMIKAKGVMDSKNPRFDYKQTSNQLSPFTYDPVKPAPKEFNKLFK